MRFVLFFLFVAMPIAEIALIVSVGSAIGVLPTLALVIATAIAGTILLRRQGVQVLSRLRSDVNENRIPAEAIGHALCIAIAGVLLLTPGFITDAFGMALFVPAFRRMLWRQLRSTIKLDTVQTSGFGQPGASSKEQRPPSGEPRKGHTIDLDEDEYRGNRAD
ncbi:MAG: FxsA family protein [Pseudomonadota bacterium]